MVGYGEFLLPSKQEEEMHQEIQRELIENLEPWQFITTGNIAGDIANALNFLRAGGVRVVLCAPVEPTLLDTKHDEYKKELEHFWMFYVETLQTLSLSDEEWHIDQRYVQAGRCGARHMHITD